MSLRLGALEDALIQAGSEPELAQQAAEEGADYAQQVEHLAGELRALKWVVGLLLALALVQLWLIVNAP